MPTDYNEDEEKGSNLLTKIALGFSLVLALGVGGLYAVGQQTKTETLDSNFKVQAVDPSVQLGDYCSGTIFDKKPSLIDKTYQYKVITAKHCIKEILEKVQINIASHDGLVETSEKSYDALVTEISPDSDVAVIEFGTTDYLPVAKIAKDPTLEFGQKVYSVSFPAGMSKTYTEGNLGYIDKAGFDASKSGNFIRATANTLGGSSGSGLFVKVGSDYVLIGTLTGGLRGNSYTNFYTPTAEINAFLESI